MAHETHAQAHDTSDGPHAHPVLPPVVDEAEDTPTWVPVVGLVLIGLLALFGVMRSASSDDAPPSDGAVAGAAVPADVVPAE